MLCCVVKVTITCTCRLGSNVLTHCALLSCVTCTSREGQDKFLKLSEADEIAGDSQEEPTNLKANLAYLFVSTTPQFTMSADAVHVYSTVKEADRQNIPSHNPPYFGLEK